MICNFCGENLDTKNCSDIEDLQFFCVCSNCKVLNVIDIDLNTYNLVVDIAEDESLEKARRLFDSKPKKKKSIKPFGLPGLTTNEG